ncbi:MAG: PQQ-dependent sugar dehydrogenase, partial [Saprospiraceae bacterium]|nr:PQQ-dependent sugar dehydrogenase [Saprospiraceae bacterium]
MFNLRLLLLIALVANASCQKAELIESSPDLRRFEIKTLATNLNEPMELDFLPDERILLIERPGWVKLYDPQTEIIQVCGEIPVHHHSENGLLGLAIDPDFEINKWIYLFYTDPVRKAYQRISRFVFDGDSIHLQSEKRLLEFYI